MSSRIEVRPESYSYVFNPYLEPIARVQPGDEVTIHCEDAFESRITTPADLPSQSLATASFLNPQTGPIYVEGAEPGDALVVHIQRIEPTRDFAVSALIPYFGGLTSTPITRTLQEPRDDPVGRLPAPHPGGRALRGQHRRHGLLARGLDLEGTPAAGARRLMGGPSSCAGRSRSA